MHALLTLLVEAFRLPVLYAQAWRARVSVKERFALPHSVRHKSLVRVFENEAEFESATSSLKGCALPTELIVMYAPTWSAGQNVKERLVLRHQSSPESPVRCLLLITFM